MTLLLIVFMILFAAAGGFLGDFLQLAGLLILVLVILGAAGGWLLYHFVRRMLTGQ